MNECLCQSVFKVIVFDRKKPQDIKTQMNTNSLQCTNEFDNKTKIISTIGLPYSHIAGARYPIILHQDGTPNKYGK